MINKGSIQINERTRNIDPRSPLRDRDQCPKINVSFCWKKITHSCQVKTLSNPRLCSSLNGTCPAVVPASGVGLGSKIDKCRINIDQCQGWAGFTQTRFVGFPIIWSGWGLHDTNHQTLVLVMKPDHLGQASSLEFSIFSGTLWVMDSTARPKRKRRRIPGVGDVLVKNTASANNAKPKKIYIKHGADASPKVWDGRCALERARRRVERSYANHLNNELNAITAVMVGLAARQTVLANATYTLLLQRGLHDDQGNVRLSTVQAFHVLIEDLKDTLKLLGVTRQPKDILPVGERFQDVLSKSTSVLVEQIENKPTATDIEKKIIFPSTSESMGYPQIEEVRILATERIVEVEKNENHSTPPNTTSTPLIPDEPQPPGFSAFDLERSRKRWAWD